MKLIVIVALLKFCFCFQSQSTDGQSTEDRLKALKSEVIRLKTLEYEFVELKKLLKEQHLNHQVSRRSERHEFDHCPNGSVRHDNSCYIVSHLLVDWAEALVYCEAYGADLVFVESEKEQLFLTSLVKSHVGAAGNHGDYYWIGGTDAVSEGEWVWAKTVEPITYTNWYPNQPDAGTAQDCMAMFGHNGQWDDGYCSTSKHNFICEINLDAENVIVG